MPTGSFQTLTLEYRVFSECDGVTEAPAFSEGEPNDSQVVVFNVQNLGVIPLRFADDPDPPSALAAPAETFVTWTILYGQATSQSAEAGLSVAVVQQVGLPGAVRPVEFITQIPAVAAGVYLRQCIVVPQGGALVVRDIQASGGRPAIVRLRIQRPEATEQKAILQRACCCKQNLRRLVIPAIRA